jgi:hypothetical protein
MRIERALRHWGKGVRVIMKAYSEFILGEYLYHQLEARVE